VTQGCQIPLSVPQLMARARENTRIDLVDHAVLEPLTVMHRSLNQESLLHERGAIAQQNKLLRLLSNRLRMQRDFAVHPEITEQKIRGPLIVSGMGRSGTTKTQKMLAASGDFNWLPYWQTYNPALFSGDPGESPQPRIGEAQAHCEWFDSQSPETRLGHPFETFEPEEDSILVEQSFCSSSFLGYSSIPSFLQWLGGQDPCQMFEFLRDTLKYLQWQGLADASKPWLLKAPIYYGFEAQILQVFPDASIVMTHRPPTQTIASSCKLISCFHQPYTNAPLDGRALTQGLGMQMRQHLDIRQRLDESLFLDLYYEDINNSAGSVLERIYAHGGLSLGEESRRNILRWESSNPRHKKGEFKYSLAQFQLGETQVNAEFAAYNEFLRQFTDR
jgi:sulfotransferase family protein